MPIHNPSRIDKEQNIEMRYLYRGEYPRRDHFNKKGNDIIVNSKTPKDHPDNILNRSFIPYVYAPVHQLFNKFDSENLR